MCGKYFIVVCKGCRRKYFNSENFPIYGTTVFNNVEICLSCDVRTLTDVQGCVAFQLRMDVMPNRKLKENMKWF